MTGVGADSFDPQHSIVLIIQLQRRGALEHSHDGHIVLGAVEPDFDPLGSVRNYNPAGSSRSENTVLDPSPDIPDPP